MFNVSLFPSVSHSAAKALKKKEKEKWVRTGLRKNEHHRSICPERSSCPEAFCKKGALHNFAKFIKIHLWWSLFFKEIAGQRPATLLKKETATQLFSSFCRTFLVAASFQRISAKHLNICSVKFRKTFRKHLWWRHCMLHCALLILLNQNCCHLCLLQNFPEQLLC